MSVEDLAQKWIEWDRDPETRGVIEGLLRDGKKEELKRLLETRMEFGTAGLRSKMGAGNSQMNSLTIIQTAQGLASYLKESFTKEQLSTQGVVIGFDGRYHSKDFARFSANVFINAGIRTRLYGQVVPTPFVAFAVRHFGCVAGVMVTASHNPKEDNGYKVYWSNGAQITSPHDTNISKAIMENLTPLESSWETAPGADDPYDTIWNEYFTALTSAYKPLAPNHPVKITYSAMHGVGCKFTLKAMETLGHPKECVNVVKAQADPNPDFPTVQFPNPEEGASALNLSMETAAASGSRYIFANDPDADRFALAEQRDDGTWRVFNGNEIGAVLGWWVVFYARKCGETLKNAYLMSSTVSSMILRSIAEKEGLHFEETLTGFKWLGSLTESLQRKDPSVKVLLAFEEAIGYMCGTRALDKDGVSVAGIMADLISYIEKEENNKRISEKLIEVYQMYGFHFTNNSYVYAKDPSRTLEMFKAISTMHNGSYPTVVAGAHVLHVRDLMTGLDTRMPDKIAKLPTSAVSPMITFYLDNGVTLTFRGSGTEPKLKWYAELITNDQSRASELSVFVKTAVEELLRPSFYGFQHRS